MEAIWCYLLHLIASRFRNLAGRGMKNIVLLRCISKFDKMRFNRILINYLTSFLIVFLLASLSASAQVQVTKSTERVVLRGKTYFIHIVEKGQTAFSIAKAYSVTVEELHQENPEALYGLKEGQTLKVPYVEVTEEPEPVRDTERFIYHTMAPGETVFALSRKYDVPQSAILSANPGVDPADLPIGSVIAIPKKEFKAETVSISPPTLEEEYTLYRVKQGETLATISRKFGVSARDIRRANRGLIFVKPDEIIKIPGRHDVESISTGQIVVADTAGLISVFDTIPMAELAVGFTDISTLRGSVDIAVMLPLFLAENSARVEIDTTLRSTRRVRERPFHWIYPGTTRFLEMYEGILLAADEIRNSGMEVRIHTYDTRADSKIVNSIINSGRLRNMDLIIGPVFSYNLEVVSAYAGEHGIPVISPVPLANHSLLQNNRELFIVNPSIATAQETLARAIAEHHESNMVFIYSDTSSVNNESIAFRNKIMRELSFKTDIERVSFKQVLYRTRSNSPTDTLNRLSHALSRNMPNIVILATENESALSESVMNLHGLMKKYDMTVYGYPSIRGLEDNSDLSYFFDLGINIYSPFRVDYTDPEILNFLNKFRKTFNTEPAETSFAWIGYDITTYFISGLALHGKRFLENPGMHNPRLLHAKFDFRRDSGINGFENWGFFRLKYTENMELVVIEEPRLSNGFRY